jgi:hypothetical protein
VLLSSTKFFILMTFIHRKQTRMRQIWLLKAMGVEILRGRGHDGVRTISLEKGLKILSKLSLDEKMTLGNDYSGDRKKATCHHLSQLTVTLWE